MRDQDGTSVTDDLTVSVETVHRALDRRSRIATHCRDVCNLTEALAAPLSAEDQTVQSMVDASPSKLHRAHTMGFFETFVLVPQAPSDASSFGVFRFDTEEVEVVVEHQIQ